MNRPSFLAVALGLLAPLAGGPALAVQIPSAGATDPRVRAVDYDPLQVVRLPAVYRTATQILFGDDEAILHVAIGDETAWDVAAEKNILFIKPKAAHGPTDLIVTTSRGGGVRNYTFELAAPSDEAGAAVYVLRFRYPADLKAATGAALSAAAQALETQLDDLKLERGAMEGPRNLAYAVQGSVALQPSEISDNGRFTLMRFPAGQAIPAVYAVTPDGAESLVPFDVRGEFVVVHAVARRMRLRQGREVLCIYDEAPSGQQKDLGTHTASPSVDRIDAPAARRGAPRR